MSVNLRVVLSVTVPSNDWSAISLRYIITETTGSTSILGMLPVLLRPSRESALVARILLESFELFGLHRVALGQGCLKVVA